MKKITFLLTFVACAVFAQAQIAATVYQIQTPKSLTNDTSQLANQQVITTGTVVGIYTSSAGVRNGFYLQGGAGAWNGVYVYAGTTGLGTSTTCVIGDSVSVTGTVTEYNGLTELGTITACTTIATGKSYVINNVTTNDANTEKWEGCIVKVKNANCTSGASGTFVVTDGSGNLSIFKQLFQTLALTTGTNYDVTGVMSWFKTGLIYELYPRNAADVVVSTGAGFTPPSADKLEVALVGNKLTVTNTSTKDVEIFNTVGAKVQTLKLIDGSAELNLAKGVYIAKAGNQTAKIMIK